MQRIIKRIGRPVYIDSLHLLALCQKLVRQALASPPNGIGTPAEPYTMTVPSQWITRWRASSREGDTYYKLTGRLIRKDKRLYVGDTGPAYLKGANREDNVEMAKA